MARRTKPVDENGVPFEQPFAGYEVNKLLGDEGLAAWWRAWDLRMDRAVVLEALRPKLDDSEDVVEEFFSTVRGVARLRHDNIVRAFDTGRAGEIFYIIFDCVKGVRIAERVNEGKTFSEEKTILLAEQIARALDYLYELGMVHGDVRPWNLIMDDDGKALLDGLGAPLDTLYSSPRERAELNPQYMAPECFDEAEYPDSRSDLYSLGCCLYQMLTGQLPFRGESASEIAAAQCDEENLPENPRNISPTISAATAGLVMSLLAKEKSERPADPAALLEKLAEHPIITAKLEAEEKLRQAREALSNEDSEGEDEDGGNDEKDESDATDEEQSEEEIETVSG